ncbi:CXXC motif containing zinc binding protein-like [Watersipora subatra]|uniref:CXXC motif containing zinc binding protein-like n=1 Tax=Watersipora subatra TaxID=2589382 RepID=UPI00355C7864
MPRVALQLQAELENITNLRPTGDDFRWYFRLKCGSCGEETEQHQYITILDEQPLKGGRGHASLVIKCKLCARDNSLDLLKDSIKPYNAENSNKFQTVAQFDCRGVEPIDFEPRLGWAASSTESNSQFDDIDLTPKEWSEYDEKAGVSVSIMEVTSQFVKSHK